MNDTAISGVLVALCALALWQLIRWWLRDRQFIWRTENITALVEPANAGLGGKRHLLLDQHLKPHEGGWTQMRIAIPDDWEVAQLLVGGGRVVVTLVDGTTYRLDRRNIGKLTFAILDGGQKPSRELAGIWRRFGRHCAA